MRRITYSRWVAVSQANAMKIANSHRGIEELSTDHRLMLLAYGRMNAAGHAHFENPRGEDNSELRRLLGHVDPKTRLLIRCSERTIYNAKAKLARAGLLVDATGGLACVWVSIDHAERAGGGAATCHFHGHRRTGYAGL